MKNENCLAGMQCPNCKEEGPFKIAVQVMAVVYDDGVSNYCGGTEWGPDDYCRCQDCGHAATVKDFTINEE